jgi:hypothetical protein
MDVGMGMDSPVSGLGEATGDVEEGAGAEEAAGGDVGTVAGPVHPIMANIIRSAIGIAQFER